jgi:hypothetical protein
MYLGPAIRHESGTDLVFSFRTERLLVTRDGIYDEEFKSEEYIGGSDREEAPSTSHKQLTDDAEKAERGH